MTKCNVLMNPKKVFEWIFKQFLDFVMCLLNICNQIWILNIVALRCLPLEK